MNTNNSSSSSFHTWVARSRSGTSSFTASALNKPSSSSSSSSSSNTPALFRPVLIASFNACTGLKWLVAAEAAQDSREPGQRGRIECQYTHTHTHTHTHTCCKPTLSTGSSLYPPQGSKKSDSFSNRPSATAQSSGCVCVCVRARARVYCIHTTP